MAYYHTMYNFISTYIYIILYFVFQAQNEISPHRRPSQSTTPSEEAAEGFICPGCMSSFLTPQDLEIHYDQEHLNGNSSSNGKINIYFAMINGYLGSETAYKKS